MKTTNFLDKKQIKKCCLNCKFLSLKYIQRHSEAIICLYGFCTNPKLEDTAETVSNETCVLWKCVLWKKGKI